MRYLHGVGDAGTRLLFKCKSRKHGLNEELGRHRGREGKSEGVLCCAECENVVHVLWKCSAYINITVIFVEKLQEPLENRSTILIVYRENSIWIKNCALAI